MRAPALTRLSVSGVTLLSGDDDRSGVTFAFTERTGGVSVGDHASLNLGDACGDDPALVAENRRRALAAIGAADLAGRLVSPRQVHGDCVVVVSDGGDAGLDASVAAARAGADAVVCIVPDVPVLLCYADCVPVVLTAPGGLAVVHSGWRGTVERIAGKAAALLAEAVACDPSELRAVIGPHIGGEDYEVSEGLLARFVGEFGQSVSAGGCRLALEPAVRAALVGAGVGEGAIVGCGISTAQASDRFFSYRASGGRCGRHGALALMRGR